MNEERLTRMRQRLGEAGLDAFLVTHPDDRRYLSGFTGSAGVLLISQTDAFLLTDFRYVEQSKAQAPLFDVRQYKDMPDTLADIVRLAGVSRIGFDSQHVTYAQYEELKSKVSAEFVPTKDLVSNLRWIKDANEIACIRKAAEIADAALAEIMPKIKIGVTESELALELEFAMKRLGAEALSFDTILAAGPNGALPHAKPTDRRLESGDFLVIDFGAVWKGYHSDMTRTFAIGEISEKQREIYGITLKAQLAALEAVRPGKTGAEIDAIARDIISEAGYGDKFGHGLGHGVGLAIHEGPTLSWRATDQRLEPGMLVTIEPGIYLPGWGGVRIEDLVVVTEDGCDILTKTSKELKSLS